MNFSPIVAPCGPLFSEEGETHWVRGIINSAAETHISGGEQNVLFGMQKSSFELC